MNQEINYPLNLWNNMNMYKCSLPKIIYNPYEVFPKYGENEVEIFYKKGNLTLRITFDEIDSKKEKSIEMEFESPVFHRLESFPGVNGMDIDYAGLTTFGKLIEFTKSEYKDAWEKHFDNMFRLSHYEIFFLNANMRFEIVSPGFRLNQ